MTIDKEQLISLLVDKTGLDRDQVQEQLTELMNRIQQAAEEGKSFEIEGFGTFRMHEGSLQFEPSNTLQTEINNKYAGMKPIELIGAFKEPDSEEIPDMSEQQLDDTDKIWAFDKDAAQQEPASETEDEQPQEAKPPLEPQAETTDAEEEFAEIFDTAEEDQTEQETETQAAPESPEETTEQETESAAKTADLQEEDDPIGRFLVAAVVIIALGLGGWFIYDSGILGGSTQHTQEPASRENQSVPAQTTGDTQQETALDDKAANQQTSSEPQQNLDVKKQVSPDEEQQEPSYGLRGAFNQSISGYTIVVHSLQNKHVAKLRKQKLEDQGFRAGLFQASVNGTTYFRVGLGQFKSVKAAQQAADDLPKPYRDEHFIKRIQ